MGTACVSKGSACSGVYDSMCDGKGNYKICKVGAFSVSSKSCVYTQAKAVTPKAPTLTWVKQEKKHCASKAHPQSFKTLKEAETACVTKGSACSGVYDSMCDGKGNYKICKVGAFSVSGLSCVYTQAKAVTPK